MDDAQAILMLYKLVDSTALILQSGRSVSVLKLARLFV
jgi:hypothetical protein